MRASTLKSQSVGTQDFYELHAAEYCKLTRDLDLTEIYNRFLAKLPPGAHILDAGCGSGRDAKAFLDRGYKVTAIDASSELARLAAEYTNHSCEVLRFQEMTFDGEFDAVWACASLLHIPRNEMGDVLSRFIRALKPGGIFYISLKEGEGDVVSQDGRFFCNYTRSSFEKVLERFPALQEIDFWKTNDVLNGSQRQPWLGFLLKRIR